MDKKKLLKKNIQNLEGVCGLEKTINLLTTILYEERERRHILENKLKFYTKFFNFQGGNDSSDSIVFTDEGYFSEAEERGNFDVSK